MFIIFDDLTSPRSGYQMLGQPIRRFMAKKDEEKDTKDTKDNKSKDVELKGEGAPATAVAPAPEPVKPVREPVQEHPKKKELKEKLLTLQLSAIDAAQAHISQGGPNISTSETAVRNANVLMQIISNAQYMIESLSGSRPYPNIVNED